MYNKVRFTAALLAIILIFSVSGCGKHTNVKNDKNSSSAAVSVVSQTSQVSQASSTAGSSAAAAKDYINSSNSFSLSYPGDWLLQEGVNGAVCTITVLADQVTGKYAQNITVTVKTLSDKSTSLDGVDENEVNHFSSTMHNYTQIANDNITLSHNIGYKIDFTSVQNGLAIRQANYITILKGREYMVTCAALADDYNSYALQFSDILKTFLVYNSK